MCIILVRGMFFSTAISSRNKGVVHPWITRWNVIFFHPFYRIFYSRRARCVINIKRTCLLGNMEIPFCLTPVNTKQFYAIFSSNYWYYRLSICRGTMQHDAAPSTTTSKIKLRSDFALTNDIHSSPYRANYGVSRQLFGEKVTARYRDRTVHII